MNRAYGSVCLRDLTAGGARDCIPKRLGSSACGTVTMVGSVCLRHLNLGRLSKRRTCPCLYSEAPAFLEKETTLDPDLECRVLCTRLL